MRNIHFCTGDIFLSKIHQSHTFRDITSVWNFARRLDRTVGIKKFSSRQCMKIIGVKMFAYGVCSQRSCMNMRFDMHRPNVAAHTHMGLCVNSLAVNARVSDRQRGGIEQTTTPTTAALGAALSPGTSTRSCAHTDKHKSIIGPDNHNNSERVRRWWSNSAHSTRPNAEGSSTQWLIRASSDT